MKFQSLVSTVLVFGVMISSVPGWAGEAMNLQCRILSSQNFISSKHKLVSGMRQELQCDQISCPDAADWNIVMNYNGNGYEQVTVEVSHKPTGTYTYSVFSDLKPGSGIEISTGKSTGRSPKMLSIMCDVESIENGDSLLNLTESNDSN